VKKSILKQLFCHLIKDLAEEVDGSLSEAHFVTELQENKELSNRLHEKTMRERKGQVAVLLELAVGCEGGGGKNLSREAHRS
jgi:hypothetical protein